ncbi:MAG: hypothetical protein AAFR83_11720, partial [Cyanobacteria bacterium J06629_18]
MAYYGTNIKFFIDSYCFGEWGLEIRSKSIVVDSINSDCFVFDLTLGDVALLRLYKPSELMKCTTHNINKVGSL